MAPPVNSPLLPLSVLLLKVSVALASTQMPPPVPSVELLLTVQLIKESKEPWWRMPPPQPKLGASPLLIVRPCIITERPGMRLKMRKAGAFCARETARRFGPGPLMVMLLLITSAALVREMVCPLSEG